MIEILRIAELETPAYCPGYIHTVYLSPGWVYHDFFLKLRASGKTASRTAIERVRLIVNGYLVMESDRETCDDIAKLKNLFKRAPRGLVVIQPELGLPPGSHATLEIETAKECRITVSASRHPWVNHSLEAARRKIQRQPFF